MPDLSSFIENIIQYKGWIVGGAFALFFGLEYLRPAVRGVAQPIKRIFKNLGFWPINIALSLLVVLPVSYAATTMQVWERPDVLSGYSGLIVDILILDVFIFWWHRAMHELPFLWRFHEVHHLDEHLDTTSAIRFHYGEVFLSCFVRAIMIFVFAIPFVSIVIFEVLVLVFSLFHHSNIKMPQGIEKRMAKIIVTPSLHWVHHHALRRDTDSNYGTIFSFWDVVFKTRSLTKRTPEMKIGVEGMKDKGFRRLLIKPFKKV